MPAKPKPGSKTWNTLNFLQAPHAAQLQVSRATRPPHASSAAPGASNASQQHQPPQADESNAAPISAQDATGRPGTHPEHALKHYLTHTLRRLQTSNVPQHATCVCAAPVGITSQA